jgi:DNA-binding response OmpR family regulator
MSKRVLLVEDDPEIRTLVSKLLKPNYAVDEAPDAHSARAFLANGAIPDVIVCDVMMPGVNGYALAKSLKANERYKHIPIIFLTAKSTAMDVVEGIQAGARFYIAKPFKPKELVEKVNRAAGG